MSSLPSKLANKWNSATQTLRLLPSTVLKHFLNKNASSPADEGDTSYADALLDLEVSRFFRSEYGSAEPPPDVFQSVLRAINEHEQQKAVPALGHRIRTSFAGLTGTLYSAFRAPVVSRLVPGGVALLLMVTALSPGISRLLGVNSLPGGYVSNSTIAAPATAPATVGPSLHFDLSGVSSASQVTASPSGNSARSNYNPIKYGETGTDDVVADDVATIAETEALKQWGRATAASLDGGRLGNETLRYGPQ